MEQDHELEQNHHKSLNPHTHSALPAATSLDLPALYRRPSAQTLLTCLAGLAVRPATFGAASPSPSAAFTGFSSTSSSCISATGISTSASSSTSSSTFLFSSSSSASSSSSSLTNVATSTSSPSPLTTTTTAAAVYRSTDSTSIPRYLTSIISNPLAWLPSSDAREEVWTVASARLSERAGRNALPTLTRTFHLTTPLPCNDDNKELAITLREPSLTADNLGHKTWAAAFLLARRLPLLMAHVPGFAGAGVAGSGGNGAGAGVRAGAGAGTITLEDAAQERKTSPLPSPPPPRILELGAGTGLVGIAAAARFAGTMHLTDLATIVPNLEHNCHVNAHLVDKTATTVSAFPLDWEDLPPQRGAVDEYDVILAADLLYSASNARLLVDTVERFLMRKEEARVVVEVPLREGDQPGVADFCARMGQLGLEVVVEGEEVGLDDWEDGTMEVRCWWAVWGWAEEILVEHRERMEQTASDI